MGAGRPTDYKPEYAEQAAKLAALGATDIEVAGFFEVNTATINEWRADYPAFAAGSAYRPNWKEDRAARRKAFNAARNARAARRRRSDVSYRLRENMRARLHAALRGKTDGRIFSRLPYSPGDVKAHLEERFLPGMSWANYGDWHVDHRKPCAMFDHSDPRQLQECWALDNLQPLWATDNIKKGGRYAGP